MRSPKDMRIIQIDITNACVHECSNCIRFCGHHKQAYFMEWEMFKKSVDSLVGFGKCVGIMGGEPTLHPQFERFVEYVSEKYPSKYEIPASVNPLKSFPRYIHDKNYFLDECLNNRKGPGLWTSVSNQYYKYYELIQDKFSFQNINDHDNPTLHQPILVSRKEIGITDEEWIPMRDNCICQNLWSASITPKGAFFCEVAGALDMLFHGPGGWKVEPGWWKREPKDFGEQLNWCEICGGALFNKGRLSNEEIDDVSPMLYEKLIEVESPKLKRGKVVLLNTNTYDEGIEMPNTVNRYLTDHAKRVSNHNKAIYPRNVDKIVLSESQLFGKMLNASIEKTSKDWIILTEEDCEWNEDLIDRIKNVVLNPGVLYYIKIPDKKDALLFHMSAKAIKNVGYDGISSCNSIEEFIDFWCKEKRVWLEDDFDELKNPDLEKWKEYVERNNIENINIKKCLNKIENDYKH